MAQTASLTSEQRGEIFHRQLVDERNRLETLHAAVLTVPNDDIAPQRHGDEFPFDLEAMEKVCDEWIAYGMPRPGEFTDLETYIEDTFQTRLSELDRINVLGGLRTLEFASVMADRGARTALKAIGADDTEANRALALSTIFKAKRQGMSKMRAEFSRGGTSCSAPSDVRGNSKQPGSLTDPNWPSGHLLEMDQSHWSSEDCAPSGERQHGSIPREWLNVGVVEAGERYLASVRHVAANDQAKSKRASWTDKTVGQFRTATMLLQKVHPGPFWQLQHADLKALDQLFDRLPSAHHKSRRHKPMSLEDICREGSDRVSRGQLSLTKIGLSITTTNRHFLFLRQLWEWVKRELPSMEPVYWKDFHVSDLRDRRDARPAYTVEQGRKLFELPIWTGCRSRRKRFTPGAIVFHDSAYWVPLLIWYSGAREAEICCAAVRQVCRRNGTWCLEIRNNEFGDVKNEIAKRLIPLASEILRLGFIEFVECLKAAGEERLFPDLVAAKTSPSDYFYKKLGPPLHKHLPFLTEGMFMHSIRHTVETELAELGVPARVRNDLLGHVNSSEGDGRYAKRTSIPLLARAVEDIPKVTTGLLKRPINPLPSRSNCANAHRRGRPRLVWDADRDGQ